MFIVGLDLFLDVLDFFTGVLGLRVEVSADENISLKIVIVVIFVLHVVFDIHVFLILIDITDITDQDILQLGLETIFILVEIRHFSMLFE
mgnify:CR=1 FL=1